MKKLKWIGSAILVLAMMFTMTACGSKTEVTSEEKKAGGTETESQEMALSGSVIVDGSGTVYPLMAHLAEEYMVNEQNEVSVQVGRAGTSAGFKKFVVGETDLSDASRKVKDEEVEAFKQGGFSDEDLMEVKLAYDGLTMVINKDNTWATEMTKDEIVKMYLSGSYNAEDKVKWSDIRPEWPSEEVTFFGPNENHGTYEFFYEKILDKKDMVKTANLQQEYSTLVDLVSKDKNAIAFFGYGYYASNQDKLQAVKVDFGSGAIAPSIETIGEELDYAGFTRVVYTYVNLKKASEKPEVLDFVKYVVSEKGAARLAGDNGFAPLPKEVYAGYVETLNNFK